MIIIFQAANVTHQSRRQNCVASCAPDFLERKFVGLGSFLVVTVSVLRRQPPFTAHLRFNHPLMPDDKTSPTPQEQHNTGFVSGNDWTTRWGNNFRLASGQMTEEGMRQMKEARDDRNAEADCARCEKQRDYLLSYSKLLGLGLARLHEAKGAFQAPSFDSCGRTSTKSEQMYIMRISAAAGVPHGRKEALTRTLALCYVPTI